MSLRNIVTVLAIILSVVVTIIVNPFFNQSAKAEQLNSKDNNFQLNPAKNAVELTKNYMRINASQDVIVQNFGKELVEKILAQPGCVGVRLYYGKHADGKSGVIIVGVDKNGKDMITGVIAKPAIICPPYCDGLI
ncbi:MAG: hypothetical protein JXA06_01655 [Bacteroidetes bacterium]|nr:hypothetical protein [Bacteroidota bacterium]